MQALIWLMEFSGACLGQLQAAVHILRSNRGVHLPDCLALRGLFSTWVALHQQHDAGEFLHHCLEYARTEAWLGGWQARLSHPGSIVDSGDLHQAILLHMRGGSLQALIDAWCGQYAVHALLLHSGTIFFQVGRYTANADKNRAVLRIRPGDSVAVPIFAEPSGTCTRHETFRVVVIVYHLGDRVTSGHYLALLGRPKGSGWEYVVCDDNRAPRRAKKADLDLVESNWSRALPITAQGPRRWAHNNNHPARSEPRPDAEAYSGCTIKMVGSRSFACYSFQFALAFLISLRRLSVHGAIQLLRHRMGFKHRCAG